MKRAFAGPLRFLVFPLVLLGLWVGFNVYREFQEAKVPWPPGTPRTTESVVVVTPTTAYSTRPLKRKELSRAILSVDIPADATDIQFAEYSEWQAYELFVTFRAPATTCASYARAILDDFNKQHPVRQVSSDLHPFVGVPLQKVVSTVLPVPWFTPEAIAQGVEGGKRGSHQPKVWVDTARGAFYYQYTD